MANHFLDEHGMKELRILVDMDGVVCDFEGHMLSLFRKKFPEEPFVLQSERNTIYMHEQYEDLKPGLGKKIQDLMNGPDFFYDLPEIDGAIDAVKEMSRISGVDVFFCTSPLFNPLPCAADKFKWIKKHFGQEWVERMILTYDKTMIRGDILIDDRHFVTGKAMPATWDHVLFSQCHNKHLNDDYFMEKHVAQRLENWTDGTWRQLVNDYKKKISSGL